MLDKLNVPIIELGCTGLTSRNFLCASVFERVDGTLRKPTPLNLVIKILRNHSNRRTGRTQHRIILVDYGSGTQTELFAEISSNLYPVNNSQNPLQPGTIVALLCERLRWFVA